MSVQERPARRPIAPQLMTSATGEWLTPALVIDRAVAVLGAIDLDPCAETPAAGAPFNVPATVHHTRADDGLAQPWEGRVYMNPPYGRGIEPWIARFLRTPDVLGIALVPARTDTRWFSWIWDEADAICFVRGRLRFSEHENGAPFPSAIVYRGPSSGRFSGCFKDLGPIVRIASVQQRTAMPEGGS